MVPNILIKCPLCGHDIPMGVSRFSIGNDDICMGCASSMTLKEIFNTEKISGVSFFDGEIWYNSFNSPENEGDTGEKYDVEIPVGPYQRYCDFVEKYANPNKMTDEEYQHWFFSDKEYPGLLTEEKFNQLVAEQNYAEILRNIYGEYVEVASERGAETLLSILPELQSADA